MAKTESAPARVAVRSAPPDRAAGTARAPMLAWWRVALLILLACAVLGVVPVMLAGEFVGAWTVRLPGAPNLAPATPAPTFAPDLALPRQAWVASRVTVLPRPGAGSPVATLEPGFPVTLAAHQRLGSAQWSHISWVGPTSNAGGDGWVPDAAVVGFAADTRPIGDLGALSPALAQALSVYGAAFAAVIYFPDSGQLYRLRADVPLALGTGFRALLITATFAAAEAHHTPPPAVAATTAVGKLAGGDVASGAAIYTQVGGSAGMARFLASAGVSGVQPAAGDWTTTQATATALVTFYAALTGGDILSASNRAAVVALLAGANTSGVSSVLSGGAAGKDGVLVVGSAHSGDGWTASAGGSIVPAHGPRFFVAVAAQRQPSEAAGRQALATFFTQLNALLAAH